MATTKMLVLVDHDVDVRDENAVWSCVAAHADPARDLVMWDGPADPLDHSTAIPGVGRKLGIDATRKRPGELGALASAQPLRWSAEIEERLAAKWPEFGL
jgi:4-hydroxy-3-polyprenylbenzoate decarboxylase